MAIEYDRKGDKITIYLKKEFGYSSRDKFDFRDIYKNQPDDQTQLSYVIDFKETKYISSNGAGQLNAMRRHCGGNDADISLINVNKTILKILEIIKFDTLFKIA
jgi:HptB-dependent secretion and biofilm anti anti-sigma factor